MNRREFLQALTAASATGLLGASKPDRFPNIVFIYADDLGYGDVSCYGATSVKTPNIDAVAARGLRFTDAHATSATCTPSRYSLMTGQYAWRKQGTGILPGCLSFNCRLGGAPGRSGATPRRSPGSEQLEPAIYFGDTQLLTARRH